MIILRISVQISPVLAAGYDEIVIYRDVSPDGTFDTEVGTLPLAPNQSNYEFADADGDLTSWYAVAYRDTDPSGETGPKSDPFQGISSVGPLRLLTVGYLRANTDFPAMANLTDAKLAEYIWRAETLIDRWGAQYGGLDNTLPNYGTMMAIAARMVAEGLYIVGNPQARARRANGLKSERIGSYQYTIAEGQSVSYANPYDFGPEVLAIMYYYLLNKQTLVSMKTTQVFPELEATVGPLTPAMVGVEIRPWHDFTDLQLTRVDITGAWVEDAYLRTMP